MPLVTVPASKKQGYLNGVASCNKTRATIFIIPCGARMGYDAKTILVSYGVAVYLKDADDPGKIDRVDTATIQTLHRIQFPQNIAAYNPLTSPTTDALADRMKMLFDDNADFFKQNFQQALRTEQGKITCYFADSCS